MPPAPPPTFPPSPIPRGRSSGTAGGRPVTGGDWIQRPDLGPGVRPGCGLAITLRGGGAIVLDLKVISNYFIIFLFFLRIAIVCAHNEPQNNFAVCATICRFPGTGGLCWLLLTFLPETFPDSTPSFLPSRVCPCAIPRKTTRGPSPTTQSPSQVKPPCRPSRKACYLSGDWF